MPFPGVDSDYEQTGDVVAAKPNAWLKRLKKMGGAMPDPAPQQQQQQWNPVNTYSNAGSAFGSLLGSIIKPGMASGGVADEPTDVEIGEGGEPEFVVPKSKLKGFAASVAAGKPVNPRDLPPDDNGGYSPVPDSMRNAPPALGPPSAPPANSDMMDRFRTPSFLPANAGGPKPLGPPVQPAQQQGQLPPAPQVKPPSTGRKIAGAILGGLTGYVNASGKRMAPIDTDAAVNGIMYPGAAREQANYKAQVQRAKDQGTLNTEAAQAEHANAQAVLARQQAATLEEEGKRAPKGNYISTSGGGLYDAVAGKWIREPDAKNPADFIEIAPDKAKALGLQPDKDGRYTIPKEGIGPYLTHVVAPPKAPSAEDNKERFRQIVSKIPNLPPSALTNVGQLTQAIRGATIPPEEKSWAVGYLAANPTPAAQGTTATIRVEGMGQMREMPVIDTQNGNSLQYLSAADINKSNKTQPGRYIPASGGTQALNKTALLEDIRGSINQTRSALAAIPEFTSGDKAKIAVALRDRDPRSAVSQLIGGAAGASMTPQQQEYLIQLAQLHEQAMAMRSVLGAGQGSDDLRAAILRTIPGPSTPNRAYAAKQLDAFEQTLNRLSRGIPSVPLRGQGTTGGAQPPAGGSVVDDLVRKYGGR